MLKGMAPRRPRKTGVESSAEDFEPYGLVPTGAHAQPSVQDGPAVKAFVARLESGHSKEVKARTTHFAVSPAPPSPDLRPGTGGGKAAAESYVPNFNDRQPRSARLAPSERTPEQARLPSPAGSEAPPHSSHGTRAAIPAEGREEIGTFQGGWLNPNDLEGVWASKLRVRKDGWDALLSALAREFPFKGYIAKTENRAITLPQLRQIFEYASRKCSGWFHVRDQPAITAITLKTLNLFDIRDWLVQPATCRQNCAMVELLSSAEQPPEWYVSHCWTEPTANFMAGIEVHSKTRQLPPKTTYWVCIFANRQWSLDQELALDPEDSSFYKAMHLSKGVLLILDKLGTPFKRIWCAYEAYVGLKDGRMLYDIATTQDSKTHLLTDGLTDGEKSCLDADGKGPGMQIKLLRELCFPQEVLTAGLHATIEEATAFSLEDKRRILNKIAGRQGPELELEPAKHHQRYEAVNLRIRSLIARAAWVQSIGTGTTRELGLPPALAADKGLTSLTFDFTNLQEQSMEETVAILDAVSDGLPSDIKEFRLWLHGSSVHVGARRGNQPKLGMTLLRLFQGPRCSLQLLELDFKPLAPVILDDHLVGLAVGLAGLERLQTLVLSFAKCLHLRGNGMAALGTGVAELRELKSLNLNFSDCSFLKEEGLASLSAALVRLLDLGDLNLNFSNCAALRGIGVGCLATGLARLYALCHLQLDFQGCVKVGVGIAAVGASVVQLPHLQDVAIGIGGGVLLKDKAKLQTQIAEWRANCRTKDEEDLEEQEVITLMVEAAEHGRRQLWQAEREARRQKPLDPTPKILSPRGEMHARHFLAKLEPPPGKKLVEGQVVASCLDLALEQGSSLKRLSLILDKTISKGLEHAPRLRELSQLEQLSLKLSNYVIGDTGAASLAASISQLVDLGELVLDFKFCAHLGDSGLSALANAFEKLAKLQHLALDFEGCRILSNEGLKPLAVTLSSLSDLKHLELNFTGCVKVGELSVAALGGRVSTLSRMQHLGLVFHGCGQVGHAGFEALSAGVAQLTRLQSLKLDFMQCGVPDRGVQTLAENLLKLQELQQVTLALGGSKNLSDAGVVSLTAALVNRSNLLQLHLDLAGCPEIGFISAMCFGDGLTQLNSLQKLCLNFSRCSSILAASLQILSVRLAQLPLQDLALGFAGCQIDDKSVLVLAERLARLRKLKLLDLDLSSCSKVTDAGASALATALSGLSKLESLKVNLEGCAPSVSKSTETVAQKLVALSRLLVLELRLPGQAFHSPAELQS